ncbi:MAG: DUF2378 family protein [Myxococcaceae bacterium]
MSEKFGRYQLLRKLATGGMGQVYLARQKGPVGFEKLVVVKRILPHLAEEPEFIQMFFDEARIAALLNHPNIGQIYDLGEVDGTYYIAMEYVHGESFRAVNQKADADKGGLPLALKCRIVSDAAGALDFAHRAKSPSGQPLSLIHRDVSPQNLLVGFNGAVKLIDFGVAKAAGKISTTMTGAVKGKYAYMSPEQARGEELDLRSDVFGLGIVFHEALTSGRLFKRESETATLRAVVGSKVPPPSSLVKNIPKGIDAIVMKALARKRSERYQDAAEFQIAIEDFLVHFRLPATSAHLAVYMRELYKGEITEDRSPGDITPARPKLASASAAAEAPQKTPSKKRLSFDEIADERAGSLGASQPAAPEATRTVLLIPDLADLDARLRGVSPADKVQGALFNSVLDAVVRFAGPIAEPTVRAAADAGQFDDGVGYSAASFLQLLWKASEVIAPMCTSVEQAFAELGAACLESLLASPLGQGLELVCSQTDGQALLVALVKLLDALCKPGSRKVEGATARSANLLYRGDVLPPQFHAGLLTRALGKLRGAEGTVVFEDRGPAEVSYRLQW